MGGGLTAKPHGLAPRNHGLRSTMPEGKRNGKSADVRASVSAKQKKLGFTEMEQAPPGPNKEEAEAAARCSLAEKALAQATSEELRSCSPEYLSNFGMLADSGALWSGKHLTRAKEEVQPMLEIELSGHSYAKHFSESPFAYHGAPAGTTARLRAWCQTLCRCINGCDTPPAVVATALRFFGAPAKAMPDVVIAAATNLTISLRVLGTVSIPAFSSILLEIMAPVSYRFEAGDFRLRLQPTLASKDTGGWLLAFDVLPTLTGRGETTFVDLRFSLRFFHPSDGSVPPEEPLALLALASRI
eukprot:g13602.t1